MARSADDPFKMPPIQRKERHVINARDHWGSTPFHFAAKREQVLEADMIIKLLIRYGADPGMEDCE